MDIPKNILEGLVVLDIGTMVAAPVAGTLMADLGAEVIKVEQPGSGDTLRGLGPYLEDESLWWNVDGRNKKSITLNLRTEQGQNILKKIITKVDIVLENFRPGTLDNWGIGYETLSKINPKLIMLSVSGFGQTGPLSKRAGYDRIGLAFGGLMNLNGYPDRPPVRIGTSMADYLTATMGAFAVMSAVYSRDVNGGPGQQIDLALYESVFRMTESMITSFDSLGLVRGRTGNVHYGAAPGDTFETKEGRHLILTCSGNIIFSKICNAMGRNDLLKDETLSNHAKRWARVEYLNDIVAKWIKSNDIQDIEKALDDNGVPYSIVFNAEDIINHPHYQARNNIVEVEHPELGSMKMQGVVPKFSHTPHKKVEPAPSVGQHNKEFYSQVLGLTEEEILEYKNTGIM